MSEAPIVLIDDDKEDLDLMREMALSMRISDQIFIFDDPISALQFLKNSIIEPLFILCDINMPKLNGFQLRTELINEVSNIKNTPFIFLSTSKTDEEVVIANELKVNGYFKKSTTFTGMKEILREIVAILKN